MNRVKQFINCIFAKITKKDREFINNYLDENEKKLLYKLPVYDLKHSVNVARDIYTNESEEEIKKNNLNHKEIVKSAILHDVGKIHTPLNVIDKSILVLLNNITKTKIKKYSDRNSKIYIFYNHGEEGYKILKGKGYDKEFLNIIRNHHNYKIQNKWLDILRKYDDRN
ncbi:HDIG domain-containing metalloprotein [Clostridium sp. UBA4395]|uniref:HDIG domain-containing metalloprotein n=1 Tax=Clostridium sp. UBA4395 TaxID=1946360 RepID=UPI003217E6AF